MRFVSCSASVSAGSGWWFRPGPLGRDGLLRAATSDADDRDRGIGDVAGERPGGVLAGIAFGRTVHS